MGANGVVDRLRVSAIPHTEQRQTTVGMPRGFTGAKSEESPTQALGRRPTHSDDAEPPAPPVRMSSMQGQSGGGAAAGNASAVPPSPAHVASSGSHTVLPPPLPATNTGSANSRTSCDGIVLL